MWTFLSILEFYQTLSSPKEVTPLYDSGSVVLKELRPWLAINKLLLFIRGPSRKSYFALFDN